MKILRIILIFPAAIILGIGIAESATRAKEVMYWRVR